ncbi:MAG TPA: RIP metalloprotease RseP, partial [Candidatus Bathyarchaeia archaeon]|nr:RIP metalloprotease RseP [Candidatus Bathyarchaeia archaeon]
GQDPTEIDSSAEASKPTGAPDELMSKKRWQRALISFAGPLVNLFFPIVLLTGYFIVKGSPHAKYLDDPLVVLSLPKDSPLSKLGVEPGDRIVSLDGVGSPTWGAVEDAFSKGPVNRNFQVTFAHQGEVHQVEVNPAGMQIPQLLFGDPPSRAIVGAADPDKPAYRAGIRRDDVITSVNGKPVNTWLQMVAAIQDSGGKPIPVDVLRNKKPLSLTVTPVWDKNNRGENTWMIGIAPGQEFSFRKVGVWQSVASATDYTVSGTWQVLDIVWKLVTRKVAVRELQSVIGIASEAGHAVQEGTFAVVSFMTILSLNLGILNLLPIPILDGGNILLLAMEGIRRRDFSMAFKEKFIQVGLVFLLILFAYVMYNDVMRHLPFRS